MWSYPPDFTVGVDLTLRARTRHPHGIKFPTVEASTNRWVALAKTSGLCLIVDLEDSNPKGSIRCHHRTVKKKLACIELLLEIGTVLIHQGFLFVGYVVRKSWPGWYQFEEVVLLAHGEGIIVRQSPNR